MFTPNVIVGLTLMALGTVLLLDRLGFDVTPDLLQYWPVLLVLFGASVAVQALRKTDPSVPQQRPVVSPGLVLFVVIVTLLFSQGFRVGGNTRASTSEERMNLVGVMGHASGTSTAVDFEGARIGGVMGRSTLDLRQATIPPGEEAIVDVFVVMGKATVLVPEEWAIDTSALPVMGEVEDQRWPRSTPSVPDDAIEATGPQPRLVLRGFVMMGKVEIQ